jgi:hypothetical protein
MARCPYGVGSGGSWCRNCLRGVDLNTTVVLYSERPSAFRVKYDRVVVASCSGGA